MSDFVNEILTKSLLNIEKLTFLFPVLDASAHFPTGVLDGTISDYGEYDECLGIEIDDGTSAGRNRNDKMEIEINKDYGNWDSISPKIKGKYCMSRLSYPVPRKPDYVKFHGSMLNVSGTGLEGTIWDDYFAQNLNRYYITQGFRAGICIPSTCSPNEIETVVNRCE